MSHSARFSGWCSRVAALARRDDRGSQMVEFAVTLPLLMVFVVGIFDFSGAFTLKQKLTNAAHHYRLRDQRIPFQIRRIRDKSVDLQQL